MDVKAAIKTARLILYWVDRMDDKPDEFEVTQVETHMAQLAIDLELNLETVQDLKDQLEG